MDTQLVPLKNKVIAGIASNFLAGITGFIGLFIWFRLRTLQSVLVIISDITIWAWQFIDISSFMILGIIWLVIVLYCQHYYQRGAEKHTLWKNFSFITGIQLLVLGLSSLTVMLLIREQMVTKNVTTMMLEGFAGIAFLLVHLKLKNGKRKAASQASHAVKLM